MTNLMGNKVMHSLVALLALALLVSGCSSSEPAEDDMPSEEPVIEEEIDEEVDETVEEVDEAADDHSEYGVLGLVGTAVVQNGEGEELGSVVFTQTEEGVLVEGSLEGLEPGMHGFHVHENGECEAPTFESAGGHFNPTEHPHGGRDHDHSERHAGDFGNIEVDEDGTAELSFVDDMITLGDGTNDVGGQAIIIHEDEDDEQTQPTGNAGPRAGCGIIEVVRGDVE